MVNMVCGLGSIIVGRREDYISLEFWNDDDDDKKKNPFQYMLCDQLGVSDGGN